MSVTTNQIIDGYKILRTDIGRGGWGVVHLAQDSKGNKVALKFLDRENLLKHCRMEAVHREGVTVETIEDEVSKLFGDKVETFKSEYQNIKKFSHPNVARAYSFGFFGDQFYIASEYVEGRPLARTCRDLKPDEMVPLFIQSLLGLEAIHKHGLLHLDIKSANILVTGEGEVKIIDFGLSMAMEALKIRVCGSVPYMPPEVLFQKRDFIGAQSDLYSFGALMYRCLAGRYPYSIREGIEFDIGVLRGIVKNEKKPNSPSEMNHDSPKHLDKITMRLIDGNFKNRFYGGNVRAVINALSTKRPDDFEETLEARASYLIPENDEHVGREEEKKLLFDTIKSALKGEQPRPAICIISGEEGMGKSHLIGRMKDFINQYAASVALSSIDLPAHNEWIESWVKDVNLKISENKFPAVIIIDNLNQSNPASSAGGPASRQGGPASRQGGPGGSIGNTVAGLVELLSDRYINPVLYMDNRPIILILSVDSKDEKKVIKTLGLKNKSFHHLKLESFARSDVEAYLKSTAALKNQDLPKKWVNKLYRATHGRPLEIAQHLQGIDSRGLLFDLQGNLRLAAVEAPALRVTRDEVPQATRTRLEKTYTSLSGIERDIVNLVAVWGAKDSHRAISYDDLYRFFPMQYLTQILGSLVAKKILAHPDILSNYSFYDEYMMLKLFYGFMDGALRRKVHLRIADYVKKNEGATDFFTIHRAYGESGVLSLSKLLKLVRKKLFGEGKILWAQDILNECIENIPVVHHKLKYYAFQLLISSHILDSNYNFAIKEYTDIINQLGEKLPKSNVWKIRLMLSVLPALLENGGFDEAKKNISEVSDLCKIRTGTVFEIINKNYEARLFYLRSNNDPDNQVELREKSRLKYVEGENLEKNMTVYDNLKFVKNCDYGQLLQKTGGFEPAIIKLKEKLKRVESDRDVFNIFNTNYTLSNTYRLMRDFENAGKHARVVGRLAAEINHEKWLLYSHSLMASIYADMEKYDSAVSEYNSCLVSNLQIKDLDERKRANISTLVNKGHCFKELKDWKMAMLHYENAVKRKPKGLLLAFALQGIGEICFHVKDFKKEEKYFNEAEKILDGYPSSMSDLYRFEIVYFKIKTKLAQKKVDEAKGMLSKLNTLKGNDPIYLKRYQDMANMLSA